MLLNRGATPSVKISIRVDRSEMVLSSFDLHGLKPAKSWDKLGLVVVRPSHLQDLLVLKQTQCRVVVAGHLSDPMTRKRVLELEL